MNAQYVPHTAEYDDLLAIKAIILNILKHTELFTRGRQNVRGM